MVGTQVAGQGEAGVDSAERLRDRTAERVDGAVDRGDHLRQAVDEVAGDGRGAHPGRGAQEVVHGLADALGVDQRSGPVPGAGQTQGYDQAAHGVDVLPAGGGVPMGVEADVQVVGVLGDIGAGDHRVGL